MTDEVTTLLKEIDEYLSGHPENSIWPGSKLHQDVRSHLRRSHLRTPRVEADNNEVVGQRHKDEPCVTSDTPEIQDMLCLGKRAFQYSDVVSVPRIVAENALRACVLASNNSRSGLAQDMWGMDIGVLQRALSRRPSEAADGARGEAGDAVTLLPQGVMRVDAQRLREILSGYSEFDAPTLFEIQSLAYEVRNSRAAPSRRLTGAERDVLAVGVAALEQFPTCRPGEHERNLRDAATLRALADRLASEDGAAVEPTTHNQE